MAIQDDDEPSLAISTARGSGPFGAIKPDSPAVGGRHDGRTIAAGDSLRSRVMREAGRSGVFVAAARAVFTNGGEPGPVSACGVGKG